MNFESDDRHYVYATHYFGSYINLLNYCLLKLKTKMQTNKPGK